jgi:hypothetical protein
MWEGYAAGSERIRKGLSLMLGRILKREDEISNISRRGIPLRAFTILQIGIRRPHGQPVEPGSGDPNIRESSSSYLADEWPR